MEKLKVQYQDKLKFDLLEILQVYRISQHSSTCVKNVLPWQLKREQRSSVEKTKTNCLYKWVNDITIRDNTICQLVYDQYFMK